MKPPFTKIEWTSDVEVHRDPGVLSELLIILGHPEALVTDCSSIEDFIGFHVRSEMEYEEAWQKLKVKVERHFDITVPEDGNIACVMQRIAQRRAKQSIPRYSPILVASARAGILVTMRQVQYRIRRFIEHIPFLK